MKKIILFLLILTSVAGYALEEKVKLETPTGNIFGTILDPDNGKTESIALLICGSGPTDRDGNSGMVFGKNNSIKYLAELLQKNGISSLRYDKRGIKASANAVKTEIGLTFAEYIDDACCWIDELRASKKYKKIVIIGHSEGALVGMVAAHRKNVRGYISLAGVGSPTYEVILKQLKSAVAPKIYKSAQQIVAKLKKGETVDKVSPALHAVFRRSVQNYLITWFKYDPAKFIKNLKSKILLIQGTTDIQVSIDEAEKLENSVGNKGELLLIDGMNHVLKDVPLNNEMQKESYGDPKLPLNKECGEAIVKFIKALK